jgi:excisionase family DNA binding protein
VRVVYLMRGSIWSIWLWESDQTDETDQIDQIDETDQFKFSIGVADIAFAMNAHVPAPTAHSADGMSATDGEILTVMDVARFLRVPKSTVYKLARLGELPASKIGKHWRFLRRDIHEWMRQRSHAA